MRRPPWVRFPPYSTAFSCGLVYGFQGSFVRHPFLLRRARHHRALSFSVPGRPGPSVGRAVPAPSFPRHACACRRWRICAYPHGQTTECVRSSEGWCSLCSPRSRHGSQLASAFSLPSAVSADCTRRSLRAGGLDGGLRSGFLWRLTGCPYRLSLRGMRR